MTDLENLLSAQVLSPNDLRRWEQRILKRYMLVINGIGDRLRYLTRHPDQDSSDERESIAAQARTLLLALSWNANRLVAALGREVCAAARPEDTDDNFAPAFLFAALAPASTAAHQWRGRLDAEGRRVADEATAFVASCRAPVEVGLG